MSALINGHDEDVRVSVPGRSGTRPGTRRVPARGSGRRPRGSRIGDVTSGRIAPGGLARIERRRIVSRWARTARGGMDCVALGSHYASRARPAPDSARTASGPTTRTSQIPAPSHPVSAGSTRTCLDPRERLPGIRSRGSPTISRPGRRPRCGGADEGRGGVRPARQQDRRERAHRHQPGSPHGRGDEHNGSASPGGPSREPARARRRDFGLDNAHPIYVITTKPPKVIQRAHGGALLFGSFMCGWTTVVRPSFSGARCASRRPGRGGAGRRGPRDRRVTAEHVT